MIIKSDPINKYLLTVSTSGTTFMHWTSYAAYGSYAIRKDVSWIQKIYTLIIKINTNHKLLIQPCC